MTPPVCSACGFENPPGMKFCGNCGARLETAAASVQTAPEALGVMMGADLMERFKRAGLEARGQRRSVSILFVDLTGYTHLSEVLGDEDLFDLVQRFIRVLVDCVYRYEGMVDKLTGDGLMALFGAPIAYENNAERALRAALDMQQGVADLSRSLAVLKGHPLTLHSGVNSGSVIVGSVGSDALMNYTAIGDTVNLARRLQEAAQPGETLVSESVRRQVQRIFVFDPLPPVRLKNISTPVTPYRLEGIKALPGSVRGLEGLHAPLVGRETELVRLTSVVSRLGSGRQGSLVLLTGDGGMGKSRLTSELKERIDPEQIRLLEGQSLTYRSSITYWIWQDVLRRLVEASPDLPVQAVVDRLEAYLAVLLPDRLEEMLPPLEVLMGVEPRGPQASRIRYLDAGQVRRLIFVAMRDLLAAEARRKPVFLILEDLHWADEPSLDLLVFLLELLADEALVIYAISRPYEGSAVQRVAEWGNRRFASRFINVRLQALQPDQSNELLQSLLAIPDLPANLREQIIVRAAGSPFYLEEILRMLIEEGLIRQQGGGWRMSPGAEAASIGVPETLQGLILSRFDRLEPAQRRVLQAAAVLGERVRLPVLKEVLADSTDLLSALSNLEAREFLVPEEIDTRVFKHVLVSDAIYATLLQRDRRELHARAGLSIERIYADRLEEQVELLAQHFQRGGLAGRALHYLILSAQKAAGAFAVDQAQKLYTQALDLLPDTEHSPEQALQVHQGLGDALTTAGDYPQALEQYRAALNLEGLSQLERGGLERRKASALERQGAYDEALSHLQAARALLDGTGQAGAGELARVLNDIGWIAFRRGDLDKAEEWLRAALIQAEPAGLVDVIASINNRLGGIFFNRDQVDQARAYVETSLRLREQIGDLMAVARTYNNLGLLSWKEGDLAAASDALTKAYRSQETLGDKEGMIELLSNLALVEMDRGNLNTARTALTQSLKMATEIGHQYQMGMAYLHLCLLNVIEQDWGLTIQNGTQARETFQALGVRDHMVGLYALLGLAQLNRGEPEAARESARLAEEAYLELGGESSGRVDDYARVKALRGELALLDGQLDVAAGCIAESLALVQQVGDQVQRARLLVIAAHIERLRQRESEAAGLTQEARSLFERFGNLTELNKLDG